MQTRSILAFVQNKEVVYTLSGDDLQRTELGSFTMAIKAGARSFSAEELSILLQQYFKSNAERVYVMKNPASPSMKAKLNLLFEKDCELSELNDKKQELAHQIASSMIESVLPEHTDIVLKLNDDSEFLLVYVQISSGDGKLLFAESSSGKVLAS